VYRSPDVVEALGTKKAWLKRWVTDRRVPHQRSGLPALAEAGFRVIVPDLRGCGRYDKPEPIEAYSFPLLVRDVQAVLGGLGIDRAHVVGDDFGAGLAWVFASLEPGSVDHLAVLSTGHPAALLRTIPQREKSWYMLFFQVPGLAERWLTEADWANMRSWAHHPDMEQVIAEKAANNSLTSHINWYRANVPPEFWVEPPQLPKVQASTMGVWSTGDFSLTEVQMTDSAEHVAASWRYERLDGPGHWLQLEAPEQVNALLLDHLPR
jgi:pimeloyl-ACP methyl ester carboxylesterase